MKLIQELYEKVCRNQQITKEEAYALGQINIENNEALEQLFTLANQIRQEKAGASADLCTIMNVKSGKCSEDCSFCAQSAHHKTNVETYSLVNEEAIIQRAKEMEAAGVHRFSLVSSGGHLDEEDLVYLEKIYKRIADETNLKICASHGMLSQDAANRLKEAGVSRYHHNLETSRERYTQICTTHTFDDRIETTKRAMDAGMSVCSGGIFGMGETTAQRIDMAFDILATNACSVPVNILNPIPGTPMELAELPDPREILKVIAIYRFIFPEKVIRYAGGRALLGQYMEQGFTAGVNGALTGDFLTTTGTNIATDQEMLEGLGFALEAKV